MGTPAYESAEALPLAQASEVEEGAAADRGARGMHCSIRAVRAVALGAVVLAALAVAAAFAWRPGLQGRRGLRVDATTQLEAWTLREQQEAEELQEAVALRGGNAAPPSLIGPGSTVELIRTTRIATTTVSPAPLYEFYMYRANSVEAATKYDFGNINTGNLDGVVWYLMNEVVTKYTDGTRCPRKFNISQINRYKIRTRATKELFEAGINFGTRFSYDFGNCMGRCFPDNQCTGQDDCDFHFDKFGFNVGCNKFIDQYPFPDAETPAPQGIWYALPLDGRCKGTPTGARDCTWSYEEAGVVNLSDVEATNPWGPNCCPKERCTGLWENPFDEGATNWRVQTIQSVFAQKFPDMPTDLGPSQCDFYKDVWYTTETDIWSPRDPWEKDEVDDEGDGDAPAAGAEPATKLGTEEWTDDSNNAPAPAAESAEEWKDDSYNAK